MYDAIVVGARCAGASTAMLLARKGLKVLLVDRDAKGSDMATSTHMMWHGGVKLMKDWGLLDRLMATGVRPMKTLDLDMGEFSLIGQAPSAGGVDIALGPKREVLDELLVDAALEAGVEYRPEVTLTDLIFEGDRAVGMTLRSKDGKISDERARIVIGADGRASSVAKMAGAEEANANSPVQGTYWAYFENLPLSDMEFVSRPGRMFYSWATNDGQTMAGMCCNRADFMEQHGDPETFFYKDLLEMSPAKHDKMRAATRVSEWRSGGTRSFSRKPFGPGWALVGDAGVTVDPISAAGISLALKDADLLANAVDQVLNHGANETKTMAEFETARDVVSLPMLGFSWEMGKLEEPPQEMINLFTSMYGNQAAIDAYFGVFAQTVPVTEFFDPSNMERIIKEATQAA